MATEAPPTYLNPIYSPFLYAANNIAVTVAYLTRTLLQYAQLSGASFTGNVSATNFSTTGNVTGSGTATFASASLAQWVSNTSAAANFALTCVTGSTFDFSNATVYSSLFYAKNSITQIYPSYAVAPNYGALSCNFFGNGEFNFWNTGFYSGSGAYRAFDWILLTSSNTKTELMYLTNAGLLSVPSVYTSSLTVTGAETIFSGGLSITDSSTYFGKIWTQTAGVIDFDYYNTLIFRSTSVLGASAAAIMTLAATSITLTQQLICTTISANSISTGTLNYSTYEIQDGAFGLNLINTTAILPTQITPSTLHSHYVVFNTLFVTGYIELMDGTTSSSNLFNIGTVIDFENVGAGYNFVLSNQNPGNGNTFWYDGTWNSTVTVLPGQIITLFAQSNNGWHVRFERATTSIVGVVNFTGSGAVSGAVFNSTATASAATQVPFRCTQALANPTYGSNHTSGSIAYWVPMGGAYTKIVIYFNAYVTSGASTTTFNLYYASTGNFSVQTTNTVTGGVTTAAFSGTSLVTITTTGAGTTNGVIIFECY